MRRQTSMTLFWSYSMGSHCAQSLPISYVHIIIRQQGLIQESRTGLGFSTCIFRICPPPQIFTKGFNLKSSFA